MREFTVSLGHTQKVVKTTSAEKALHSAYPNHLWTFKGKLPDKSGAVAGFTFEYTTTVKGFVVSVYVADSPLV